MTENGQITLFIGGHYEVTGSQITKYYFAGTQRIAMRKSTIPSGSSVEYLLSDHLGSTSINTDASGAKVSEMRYSPWGEIRSSWTASASISLADYTFTGQYSYMDDPSTSGVTEGFGLMFYNARMYDPALGRFTSADSIVPAGVQGYDRFAYVNNNPIRYMDPSGHNTECGFGEGCAGNNNPNDNEEETCDLDCFRANRKLRNPIPPFSITSNHTAGCGMPFSESPSPNRSLSCTNIDIYSLTHDQADTFENFVYVHALEGTTITPNEFVMGLFLEAVPFMFDDVVPFPPGLGVLGDMENMSEGRHGLTFGGQIFEAKRNESGVAIAVIQNMYLVSDQTKVSNDGLYSFTATNVGKIDYNSVYFSVGSSHFSGAFLASDPAISSEWIQFLDNLIGQN